MTALVEGYGCRPVANACHGRLGPASGSLQGRNPRELGHRRCGLLYGDCGFAPASTTLTIAADPPLRKKRWFVYTKEPFAGPKQVLAYLSRYTHRVAISNSRLLRTDGRTVTFRVKNYRANGRARYTTMTLDASEFIRRFLAHVLPKGFHRIRHYGLLATGLRAENIARARELLDIDAHADNTTKTTGDGEDGADLPPCPCCGSRLRIIETFLRGQTPMYQPTPRPRAFRIDTS